MKVVPFDDTAWHMDHPKGTVAFNYLLMGGADDPLNNFRYILGKQVADFYMPRHRHTFDQIRLPLIGDMNLGEQGILHEGEIGYFPEGQTYGPQDDKLGTPNQLQLVLQFGGASGLGMGTGRAPRGREIQERLNRGETVAPRQQKFPRPRYKSVIIADPANFNWLPLEQASPRSASLHGVDGVEHKYIGSFSERGVWIEMIKVDAGTSWTSTDPSARRIFVVLSGAGAVDGQEIGRLAAMQADPGEELRVTAAEELVLYLCGLPPVELPAVQQDNFDVVEVLGGATQFEDPKDQYATTKPSTPWSEAERGLAGTTA
jgi:hypothetical protein